MDLTKGYHQAPLSIESRKFTAFTTYMGVYEWLRVPMGIKGAPSYFQQVIATVVLIGLLYVICELYIDDIIVHAKLNKSLLTVLNKYLNGLENIMLLLTLTNANSVCPKFNL